MAELVEFSWDQITIGDNGFRFHIVCAGQNPIDPRLSCRYMDQEAHEIVQIGDEGSIELCPTIPSARWEELADFLRKAELPAMSRTRVLRAIWRYTRFHLSVRSRSHGGTAAKSLPTATEVTMPTSFWNCSRTSQENSDITARYR